VDDFYAARTANMAALPWSNFAPPFSIGVVEGFDAGGDVVILHVPIIQ
jgi:hypothetical protein